MIRKLFLLAILTLLAAPAFAQEILPQLKREKPDMDQIKRETQDPTSKYYYPRLIEEYFKNDTTMAIDKYRRLYLGYVFQEDYTPYRTNEHPLEYTRMLEKDKMSRGDRKAVADSAKAALYNNPFDLRELIRLIGAYRENGQTNLAKIWQNKLNYLLMAIVSTGTGMDEENAWYVIEPQHEYVLLNMLGYTVSGQVFYDPYYEFIKVTDGNNHDLGGFYFNIKNLLEEYYRKHPEEL